MPALEATLVCGIDQDGIREARNLAALYPQSARYCRAKDLVSTLTSGKATPLFLIMVGHDVSGMAAYLPFVEAMRSIGQSSPIIVLAMCSSANMGNPARDSYPVAQKIASSLRTEVRATTRFLTFAEVGRGTAFAKSALASFILPSNDPGRNTDGLWVTISPTPTESVDTAAILLSNLNIN